jgi:hypothetical protein
MSAVPIADVAPAAESSEEDSLDVAGLTALSGQTGGAYAALREQDSLIPQLKQRFTASPGAATAEQPDVPRSESRQPLFLFASALLFCVSLGLAWGPLRVYP